MKLSKLEIISLAIGSIIGWGAFVLPGDLFLKEIGILNSIIGLFIGLLIVCVIERNYSYLINKIPISGGEYIYTKKILGEKHSFICGWFLSLAYICIVPLNATAISMIFNILTKDKYIFGYIYDIQNYKIYFSDIIISSIFIVFLGYLNIKGVKLATYFQKIMVFLLVGIIIIFFLLILYKDGIVTLNILSHYNAYNIELSSILKIVAISPWAYVGFDCVTQILEELNFSNKTISKISKISLTIGFLLYILILIITAYGINYKDLIQDNTVWATGKTIEFYFGNIGIILLGIALLSAVICGVNGFYINSTRLIALMAKEKQLPKILYENSKDNIPKNAIKLVMFLSLITPWFGRRILIWIVDMSSLGIAIAYLYISIVTLILYYKENKKIKISGVLGCIFSFVFIVLLLFPFLSSSLGKESIYILGIWIAIGLIYRLKSINFLELKR